MAKIRLPQAGNTMEDGTIIRWAKAEGEPVEVGEVLLEVETDKAAIQVESNVSGTVRKILAPEGATVPVHAVIAIVAGADEDIGAELAEAERQNASLAAAAGESVGPGARAAEAAPAAAAPAAVPTPAKPPAGAPPAATAGVVIPILMPQAGNTMEEGTVVKWRVGVGDRINVGDVIFDVETDKATIEVEAVDAGRLARIAVDEGETIEVKRPVAYLAENDADVEAYVAAQGISGPAAAPVAPARAAAPQPPAPAAAPAAAHPTETGRVRASPAARKIASQRGIDLASIGAGSGPGGRIVSSDVPAAPAPAAGGAGQPIRRAMSKMRRAIARNLLAAKRNIPHFYMRLTIDAGPLVEFYRAQKAKYKCTVTDVIVLACARVIREFPAFRRQLDGEELVEYPSVNVGIAVGLDEGLVVPVLLGADRMRLQQVGAEAARIVEAARSGRVEAMGQGVFTVTNVGMLGIEEFSAIINPPEAAILAVGAVREEVIVRDGTMHPGKLMTLTLSADHRIIDGLVAAKFLARLKELLESPAQLLQAGGP